MSKRPPVVQGNLPPLPPRKGPKPQESEGGQAICSSGRITVLPDFPPLSPGGLSPSEVWLLDLWLAGSTEQQMAEQLNLSAETVQKLKRRVLGRLNALKLDQPTPAAG